MIIQKNEHSRNGSAMHFKLTKEESKYILFRLHLQGLNFARVGAKLQIGRDTVFNVIYGRRRSKRVETEIASILGAKSWNHLVAEARYVVNGSGKPTSDQIEKALQQAINERQALIEKSKDKQWERVAEVAPQLSTGTPAEPVREAV